MANKITIEEKFMLKEMFENINSSSIELIAGHMDDFIDYLSKIS